MLFVAIAVAGCGVGTSTAGADATNPCADLAARADDPQFDPIPACKLVLSLANDRLGWLHWPPVSEVRLRLSLCPPNARCLAEIGISRHAWVLYRFWSGDPVMIHVGPREAGDIVTQEVFADAPEPLPEWLLEELDWEGRGAKDGIL